MGLETGTYVSDLVITNPLASDLRSQGDDHLRLIKKVLQNSFPKDLRGVSTPLDGQSLRYDGTSFKNRSPVGLYIRNNSSADVTLVNNTASTCVLSAPILDTWSIRNSNTLVLVSNFLNFWLGLRLFFNFSSTVHDTDTMSIQVKKVGANVWLFTDSFPIVAGQSNSLYTYSAMVPILGVNTAGTALSAGDAYEIKVTFSTGSGSSGVVLTGGSTQVSMFPLS